VGTYGSPASLSNNALEVWTAESWYVLRADGTFSLAFPWFEYGGTYTVSENEVAFRFSSWGSDGYATGTLTDQTLTVRYNMFMSLTDFEDAVYARTN
jgi:hypothetical protein